mmetsp:Transcript_15982/g.56844  ORF Transcript_15982/g.56844 Transcript_15982/m.56844 type:complete len:233 (-) Transcript_15982:412-1110(-)
MSTTSQTRGWRSTLFARRPKASVARVSGAYCEAAAQHKTIASLAPLGVSKARRSKLVSAESRKLTCAAFAPAARSPSCWTTFASVDKDLLILFPSFRRCAASRCALSRASVVVAASCCADFSDPARSTNANLAESTGPEASPATFDSMQISSTACDRDDCRFMRVCFVFLDAAPRCRACSTSAMHVTGTDVTPSRNGTPLRPSRSFTPDSAAAAFSLPFAGGGTSKSRMASL